MKKTINRFVAIVASIVLSIPATSSAFAAGKDSTTVTTAPAALEFVGKVDNQPVFRVKVLDSANPANITVTVTDDNGTVLTENTLKSTSIRFVLSDDVRNVPLHFSIYDRATKATSVYNVNPRFKMDENFDVTKL
ncbi:hypothetical protein [Ferruginibacter albus]|uniref:hypothetical protein n=1 Tax=Ferruginibacter albus TaxID=2875540 RepID=UPI001CC6264A|nr:hypothetical protein [Ferruginibacter albus]UAY51631.1 hypothetical protein K9M53_13670 [Ferruginibacter albus]